jgi:hypothetical protein
LLVHQVDLAAQLGVDRRECRVGIRAQAHQPVVRADGPEQQHGGDAPEDDGLGQH